MPHKHWATRRKYQQQYQQAHKAESNAQARRYYQLLKARGICRDCGAAVEDTPARPDLTEKPVRCRPCRRRRAELRQTTWNEKAVVARRARVRGVPVIHSQ